MPGDLTDFRYCPYCGEGLVMATRGARQRPSCASCGYTQYKNPVAGVAVVIVDAEGRVLLGERATGEYAGRWCIPCGYVEWDEEIRAAAVREFEEETGLRVETGEIIAVHSNFHNERQHTVGTWFAGRVLGGELHPVDGEFRRLAYFDPASPPALAFATDALVLRQLAEG